QVSAVRRLADEDPAIDTRPTPVLAEHLLAERLDGTAGDEVDRAATEAPARDARPEHARALPRKVHQEIDLRAAHLVVVSQRGVGGVHQFAEASQVASAKSRLRLEHPSVLGHDVKEATVTNQIELCEAGV